MSLTRPRGSRRNLLAIFTVSSAYLLRLPTSFPQDVGVLGGEYGDFERGWYATVGVAVSMTMLLNVIVPHVKPLVG